jgi:hypothetical protein
MNIEKEYNNDHIIFLSSDESEDDIDVEKTLEILKNDTQNATTGVDIPNKIRTKPQKNIMLHDSFSSDSSSQDEIINGWDDNANNTIKNWYDLFKQQSFIYQWVIERNKKMSNYLISASIAASSALGIFSSFKLWIKNDKFIIASDIFLMLTNFSIAFITNYSKSYIDDKRNEIIRIYIDEVDELLGEISAQVLKSPCYRINANDFFKDHNYKYTKLITCLPNISISELNESKKEYEEFRKHFNQ